MKVFLAEDNFVLSKALINFFEIKNYGVTHFDDGEDAFSHIETKEPYDIYVIDINLPNISGLELIKQIRRIDNQIPIIVITASIDITNLENAYDFGCSEYIKKPFNLKELDIRLQKLISNNNISKIIVLNNSISFDLKNKILLIDTVSLELRKKELRFLTLLFQNNKQIVSTQALEEYIWEGEIKESYPLRQLVNGLRKKIPFDFIKTEVGLGYKLNENC